MELERYVGQVIILDVTMHEGILRYLLEENTNGSPHIEEVLNQWIRAEYGTGKDAVVSSVKLRGGG